MYKQPMVYLAKLVWNLKKKGLNLDKSEFEAYILFDTAGMRYYYKYTVKAREEKYEDISTIHHINVNTALNLQNPFNLSSILALLILRISPCASLTLFA